MRCLLKELLEIVEVDKPFLEVNVVIHAVQEATVEDTECHSEYVGLVNPEVFFRAGYHGHLLRRVVLLGLNVSQYLHIAGVDYFGFTALGQVYVVHPNITAGIPKFLHVTHTRNDSVQDSPNFVLLEVLLLYFSGLHFLRQGVQSGFVNDSHKRRFGLLNKVGTQGEDVLVLGIGVLLEHSDLGFEQRQATQADFPEEIGFECLLVS